MRPPSLEVVPKETHVGGELWFGCEVTKDTILQSHNGWGDEVSILAEGGILGMCSGGENELLLPDIRVIKIFRWSHQPQGSHLPFEGFLYPG